MGAFKLSQTFWKKYNRKKYNLCIVFCLCLLRLISSPSPLNSVLCAWLCVFGRSGMGGMEERAVKTSALLPKILALNSRYGCGGTV